PAGARHAAARLWRGQGRNDRAARDPGVRHPDFRALRIARVLLKHRLYALLEGSAFGKWLWLLRPFVLVAGEEASYPRGQRLRLALQELGPIFTKFGQVLSTRRDLLPPDVADELALLRDP